MENMGGGSGEQEVMDLPPGFRFHPTDEELISHYLSPKAIDNTFSAVAVGEVDLNECEPWDLPKRAKMGEKEWYFFVVKDRKYPTGMRTNRATKDGYWKATGKDKEIFRAKSLVGMKKTLVFYKGRAPKGVKSNWVMHEYRLEGPISLQKLPSNSKNEWVICRIFHKSAGGKRIPFTGLMTTSSYENDYIIPSGNLPPLMESSPTQQTKHGVAHVSCFSNPLDPSTSQNYTNQNQNQNQNQPPFDGFINNHSFNSGLDPTEYFPKSEIGNSIFSPQTSLYHGNYMMSEQHILRAIFGNHGADTKQSMKTEGFNYSASQDTCLSSDMNAEISSVVSQFYMGSRPFDDPDGDRPSTSGVPVDLDGFLNY